MKLRILIGLIVLFYACANKEKGIIYEFKMVNDSEKSYLVQRHYRYTNIPTKTDTLLQGDQMVFSIPRVGNYDQPFGDTLIRSFFDTLLVKMIEDQKITYVYKRSNWKEDVDLDSDFFNEPGHMKGKVIYTLKLSDVVPSSAVKDSSGIRSLRDSL